MTTRGTYATMTAIVTGLEYEHNVPNKGSLTGFHKELKTFYHIQS